MPPQWETPTPLRSENISRASNWAESSPGEDSDSILRWNQRLPGSQFLWLRWCIHRTVWTESQRNKQNRATGYDTCIIPRRNVRLNGKLQNVYRVLWTCHLKCTGQCFLFYMDTYMYSESVKLEISMVKSQFSMAGKERCKASGRGTEGFETKAKTLFL